MTTNEDDAVESWKKQLTALEQSIAPIIKDACKLAEDDDEVETLLVQQEVLTSLYDQACAVILKIEGQTGPSKRRDALLPAYIKSRASLAKRIRHAQSQTNEPSQDEGSRQVLDQTMITGNSKADYLPRLELPKFRGSATEWLSFKARFEKRIATLNEDASKYAFLAKCLEYEPARNSCEALENSGVPFTEAWAKLEARFYKKRIAYEGYFYTLLKIKRIHKASQRAILGLIDAVDTLLSATRQIANEQPGEPDCIANGLLICLVKERLDESTLSKIEEKLDLQRIYVWSEFKIELERLANQMTCKVAAETAHSSHRPQPKVVAAIEGKAATTKDKREAQRCYVCHNEGHTAFTCPKFTKMSIPERWETIKAGRHCFNCLIPGHSTKECKSQRKCQICSTKHHTLLHRGDSPKGDEVQQLHPEKDVNQAQARSQVETITEKAARSLGIPQHSVNVTIKGVSGQAHVKRGIKTVIASHASNYNESLELIIVPKILDDQPSTAIDEKGIRIPEQLHLADPQFYRSNEIDILLGARIFFKILMPGRLSVANGLTYQESSLGWIACGTLRHSSPSTTVLSATRCSRNEFEFPQDEMAKLIEKFWRLEEACFQDWEPKQHDECEAESHFRTTLEIAPDGRYITRMPLRGEPSSLGDSYQQAYRRFTSLEQRLKRNADLYKEYRAFMNEYETLGHMVPVTTEDFHKVKYFIPHSCVVKPDSTSTKVRVVFDASAKTSTGVSLNDIQIVGPTIQKDLFDLLIDFKTHNDVLVADIAKMYRQIHIAYTDTWLQCILWRDSPNDQLKAYRLTTVTYGEASSSFLACRALHEAAEDYRSVNPRIADTIQRSFYVDNLMIGASNADELTETKREIEHALSLHGFPLRKWASNNASVLEGIPEKDLEPLIQVGDQEVIKTLGIAWNPKTDVFQFISTKNIGETYEALTKRQMVSKILRLYDPIGLIQPVIITAKILMQELWTYNVSWDDDVPDQALSSWKKFEASLVELSKIEIPRMSTPSHTIALDLHGFSDASEKAYGCVIYLHAINLKGEESTNLLCSKSRVAPLKKVTLPRLELLAAALLAELTAKIKSILAGRISSEYYYSDSQVALSWIKSSNTRWGTFIRNRVQKIHSTTNPEHWKYISTKENPADMVSRGIPVRKLREAKLEFWLHGPECIRRRQYYLQSGYEYTAAAEQEEIKEPITRLVAATGKACEDLIAKYPHHHTHDKTVRHFAWLCRAINNMKKVNKDTGIRNEKRSGPLTTTELNEGLTLVVRIMQATIYPNEVAELRKTGKVPTKGPFQHLNAIVRNGVIHVTGRLHNAEMPISQKNPILIPKSHPFSRVIIQKIHEDRFHAGTDLVINEFRQRFWMRDLRRTVQGVIQRCILCAKARPRRLQQRMGQLPSPRVNESVAFTHTGVDLCGPFEVYLNQKSKCKTTAYACIFICFATKAVHLEVVEDQSTAAFISALLRFTSVRGIPEVIYSDNGRNFVGASRELNRLRRIYNNEVFQNKLVDIAATHRIRFSFIPPRSPSFGGLWEANIKVAKRLFSAAARGAQLNIMELQTLFYQVAAIMNSRPLTPVYTTPDSPTAITPGHFLIARPMLAVPIPTQSKDGSNLTTRWKRVQSQLEQFWRRWRDEYLHQLRDYAKWTKQQANVKVGQIVLIGDDHLPVARWPMGIVTQIHPGDDGVVRVAVVRTATGIYKRNVRTLAPLPVEEHTIQPIIEEYDNTADNEQQSQAEAIELEDDPPPQAPQMIWDVGFLLSAQAQAALIKWEPINERIIVSRLRIRARNPTIIQCYVPTDAAKLRVKENFYNQLNAIGELFAEFCANNNMVIGGSLFPHRPVHKVTWSATFASAENGDGASSMFGINAAPTSRLTITFWLARSACTLHGFSDRWRGLDGESTYAE
ncbi:uncharacterized protein LOC129773882 [Toxorhynchites rutilus septentrionalis]|uniref:uncharacterized protein LOC129773882 n=1 Tax=Toxorhynchites rutilus septentrionalis TaxID=329112 RepID=UPI002479CE67|nr:uncharacterized protein LOC129773882 [Toxorhynchites rutilus septentrionalis]